MGSPFRASNRSSSSPRSTPSRGLPNGIRKVNGHHRSSLRSPTPDSPSHQLLEEFGRMLILDERSFKHSLDEQTAAQQKLHLEALDRALAIHEEVRESAERVREQVELELERERTRRIEEEKKAVEKARRELEEQKIEEQRQRHEEAKAREQEKIRTEQLRLDAENLERQKAEASRREQEEARQREEARKKEEESKKAQQSAPPKPDALVNGVHNPPANRQTAGTSSVPNPAINGKAPAQSPQTAAANPTSGLPPGLVTDAQERETMHDQYLELHKRLKQMRIDVLEECKKIPKLKDQVSDWRRAIVKCCGQMSKGTTEKAKQGNRRAIQEIQTHLDAAVQVAEPSTDVTQYLVENRQPPNANRQGPAVLVYLLNHFAKGVLKQLNTESSVDPKAADAIGVLAVTIFARPQYLFNGQSLIDILWAKYHFQCPILFGISGSESTKAGRLRLGWEYDKEANVFTKPQMHYDRMSGLGAGFASITLRDFSKSKNANPAPNRFWWQAVARIVNTPAADVQPSHFVVLKAIIAQDITRILKCFGGAGLAVLRTALVTFPSERGPQDANGGKIAAVTAVQAIAAILERDFQLTL